jgi:hypothetical protein
LDQRRLDALAQLDFAGEHGDALRIDTYPGIEQRRGSQTAGSPWPRFRPCVSALPFLRFRGSEKREAHNQRSAASDHGAAGDLV